MRGTKSITHGSSTDPRITPACAGNRRSLISLTTRIWDHPRVCGEQLPPLLAQFPAVGSPPRVRGTGGATRRRCPRAGITPACAGNSSMSASPGWSTWDHPRVCGEQRSLLRSGEGKEGSPPRVRGTAKPIEVGGRKGRITPACAGNSEAY